MTSASLDAHPIDLVVGTDLTRSRLTVFFRLILAIPWLILAIFWGIRLSLQAVLDVKEHLTAWWLVAGEWILTILFAYFATVFTIATLWP